MGSGLCWVRSATRIMNGRLRHEELQKDGSSSSMNACGICTDSTRTSSFSLDTLSSYTICVHHDGISCHCCAAQPRGKSKSSGCSAYFLQKMSAGNAVCLLACRAQSTGKAWKRMPWSRVGGSDVPQGARRTVSLTLLVPSPAAAPDSVYSAPRFPCAGPHSACERPKHACLRLVPIDLNQLHVASEVPGRQSPRLADISRQAGVSNRGCRPGRQSALRLSAYVQQKMHKHRGSLPAW